MDSKFLRSTTIVVFLSVLIFSCKKEEIVIVDNDTGNNGTGNTSPTVVYNVNRSTFLQLVNNVRLAGCKCGATTMPPVAAVSWNDKLAKAAFDHSADMMANDYFSHTGLNGSTAGQRITAAGYPWKTFGENIAKGYANEQSVMNGWLGSEGHCKNIMNPNFREMGAGRQGDYWTQEFGAR